MGQHFLVSRDVRPKAGAAGASVCSVLQLVSSTDSTHLLGCTPLPSPSALEEACSLSGPTPHLCCATHPFPPSRGPCLVPSCVVDLFPSWSRWRLNMLKSL